MALVAGISGCGGDNATSSETQDSSSATTAEKEGNEKTEAPDLQTPASKVIIGDYPPEGPFAGISGRGPEKKPHFEPSGQPVSKKETLMRELKVGSGPAAEHGDEVSFYYAGADHKTGKVTFYGWPPYPPKSLRLGLGTFGKKWEKTLEGMKVGGIRQVIVTLDYLAPDPLDYVIVLKALQPQSEES